MDIKENIKNEKIQAALEAGNLFEGEWVFSGVVKFNAKLSGSIQSPSALILGQNAEIVGDVHVRDLVVAGHVRGNVYVKNILEVHKTAVIEGNIHCKRLIVWDGAQIKGQACTGYGDEGVVAPAN